MSVYKEGHREKRVTKNLLCSLFRPPLYLDNKKTANDVIVYYTYTKHYSHIIIIMWIAIYIIYMCNNRCVFLPKSYPTNISRKEISTSFKGKVKW